MARPRKPPSPFGHFNASPKIRLVVMMCVKFPRSLRDIGSEQRLWSSYSPASSAASTCRDRIVA
jgi:hypothetical protein